MALLLTAAQMRAMDRAVIETLGLPGLVLMENAGRGVADIIACARPEMSGLDVRVVCGAGQNGGDGFVIARHLLCRGAKVRVLLQSTDGDSVWTTVGVSTDIIEASWIALVDSIEYKLLKLEEAKVLA